MKALGLGLAVMVLAAGTARAGDPRAEVKATFERFVVAQNAHDAAAVEALLSDSDSFLWITRGTAVWGRAQALARFRALYGGTWQLDPDMEAFRVTVAEEGVAVLFVPVVFTIGAAGEAPQKSQFLMNQVLRKGPGGWRIASILPIPAATPPK